jgi:hypothetical protein
VEVLKQACMEELGDLNILEEERGLAPEEKVRKYLVIRDLENTILQEEISWRQNSRVLWLKRVINALKIFILGSQLE